MTDTILGLMGLVCLATLAVTHWRIARKNRLQAKHIKLLVACLDAHGIRCSASAPIDGSNVFTNCTSEVVGL